MYFAFIALQVSMESITSRYPVKSEGITSPSPHINARALTCQKHAVFLNEESQGTQWVTFCFIDPDGSISEGNNVPVSHNLVYSQIFVAVIRIEFSAFKYCFAALTASSRMAFKRTGTFQNIFAVSSTENRQFGPLLLK